MKMVETHVMTCHAEDCSYNCSSCCCAPLIEIGDEHPMCDMFTMAPVEIGIHDPAVSKCMVDDCHFNSHAACEAAGITLTRHADHADCATFRA